MNFYAPKCTFRNGIIWPPAYPVWLRTCAVEVYKPTPLFPLFNPIPRKFYNVHLGTVMPPSSLSPPPPLINDIKVSELRSKYPSLDIEVDGGVGPATIHHCAQVLLICLQLLRFGSFFVFIFPGSKLGIMSKFDLDRRYMHKMTRKTIKRRCKNERIERSFLNRFFHFLFFQDKNIAKF